MKNDKTKIEPGIRVTVKGKECDWGVGMVLMKNETIGQCMVKFEKCHDTLHTCNGIFDEKRYTWVAEENMDVLPEQEKADPLKNWTVMLTSINGSVSHMWRVEEERFGYGWLEEESLTLTEALRKMADMLEKEETYIKLCGGAVSKEKDEDNRYDAEKIGKMIELMEEIKKLEEK